MIRIILGLFAMGCIGLVSFASAEASAAVPKGKIKAIKEWKGKKLTCYSNRSASAYPNLRGQWSLKANVKSEYTMLDAKLSNRANSSLGGEIERTTYDRGITDVRVFALKADVDCNNEIIFPRDWTTASKFRAQLESKCDVMDESLDLNERIVSLTCSVR